MFLPKLSIPSLLAPAVALSMAGTGNALAQELPDAERLITQCIAAMGGRDVFEQINTSKVITTAEIAGQKLRSTTYAARDGRLLIEQTMGEKQMDSGSDGDIVWAQDPAFETGYGIIPDEQNANFLLKADLAFIPIKLFGDARGARTVETKEFAESQCYVVELVNDFGGKNQAFLDVDTKLVMGLVRDEQDWRTGQTIQVELTLSDYQRFGDLFTYARIRISDPQFDVQVSIDEIEINTVDDRKLELPAAVKQLKEQAAHD